MENTLKKKYKRVKGDINRMITISGKLKLMRNNQFMILASHYPTSINPHKNPKSINSIIKKLKKEQFI